MPNLKIVHSGVAADNFQLPAQKFAANGSIQPIGGLIQLDTATATPALTLYNTQPGQVYHIYKRGTNGATITLNKAMVDGTTILTFAVTTVQSVTLVINQDGNAMPISVSAGITYS